MSRILAAVGRGAINRTDDVRIVQALLNQHLSSPQRPLAVDGVVGPRTIAAIEEFQRRVVKIHHPDGRFDPGGRTFTALSSDLPQPTPPSASGLPAGSGGPL